MKAKAGYKQQKRRSPHIGRWLHRYFARKTCKHEQFVKWLEPSWEDREHPNYSMEALGKEYAKMLHDDEWDAYLLLLDRYPDKTLALAFDVSLPTVRRWKTGINAPAPGMREGIYEWLKENPPPVEKD